LKPRTIANMVHDNIELMAKEIFKGKGQDIAVYTKKGFLIINFYGRIFLRFKKLQNCLMPCNIQTEQQRAFDEQTLFEGHITHLSAGYRLNDIGEYKDAHIVCVAYRKLQWNLKLPEVKEAITRNSDLVTSDQPIVVVRKSASKKLGEAS
ncbi:MAG: hypothetical protein KAI59_03700, partial [Planctomycetes bacterium]|nr:hypothetical protein [Planctomycetota bacterium]